MEPDVSAVLDGFPRERRWLLPALRAVQHAEGWISEPSLSAIAAWLRVPASEVHGVASAYPELRLAQPGRHVVRVCTGVACGLLGGGAFLDALAARHRVKPGQTTADGEMTLESADCLFACSMAPLVEVDGACHGRVGEADLAMVDRWFRGAAAQLDLIPGAHGAGAADGDGHAEGRGVARGRQASTGGSARAALASLRRAAFERVGARPPTTLTVQGGGCADAVGAAALRAALASAVAARGLAARVVDGACGGACYAAPAVAIAHEGWPRVLLERVEPRAVGRLLDALAGDDDLRLAGFAGVAWTDTPWRGLTPAVLHAFWAGQERLLLARAGWSDPADLDEALAANAYAPLAHALEGSPEAVIAAVKASGLQGRGGAFFPTALKWEACRRAAGPVRYVVMNGEEGEPGIFKDRHLLEADPHQVLEGVLLAAWAVGAGHAFLYIHGEAEPAARRLAEAVAAAEAAGLAGEEILGTAFSCTVEILRGGGGFVLGEETALLESIEGRRPQPRTRPPFPVETGLWGRPTVINNVETLAAIPAIVAGGGEAFAALGTARAPGTKLFGLAGPLRRPGVVEVRNGVTLRALLDDVAGGLAGGRAWLGAVVGGPSGSIVPAALFDVPMEPRGQVSPGTGGIAALPAEASVRDVVRTLLAFNARESCGKCTPCREGLPRLLTLLDTLKDDAAVPPARELSEAIQLASLCGLGQAASLALVRALEDFGAVLGAPR
ncbi:MAG: NAD(P)H-dependent oxidoreductase subunit E [Candidatus Rokubacteria bacterium]|nr:NAD(P)H-dependent oxidoreductase subunit E [Candidatus Rokubacteria bacterium]